MRICLAHYSAMRKKIDDLGLTKFVAASGAEMMEREARHLENFLESGEKLDPTDWDPLASMGWNFAGRVMESLGLAIFEDRASIDSMPENKDEIGFNHVCPLCVVRRDFDHHNTPTGQCGKPECDIHVASGELAWDELWIQQCGDAMFEYAKENKLVSVN